MFEANDAEGSNPSTSTNDQKGINSSGEPFDSPKPPETAIGWAMTARIIPFPQRGPFSVHIMRDGEAWLVVCRDHGWLHSNINDAIDIAVGFAVQVKVKAV